MSKKIDDGTIDGKPMDYTKLVMEDMYGILISQRNPWPVKYTKLKKLEFLDKMLKYLKSNQLYEMCAGVELMRKKVINESVSKNKKSKR